MYNILQGVRPKAPIFALTRGYTTELWEVTTSCWKVDPSERPTVDYVLAALRSSAEQRQPQHGEISPMDNRSHALLIERSDSPIVSEHENKPATITVTAPLHSTRPPIIRTPVPLARTNPHSIRSRTFDREE